jgi:catechol 2,3-dioxygenase-like lactoylglutathione lyase family enzyme
MNVTSITVGIPVSDLRVAVRWYQRVLELDRGIEPAPGIREFEVSPGCWLQLFREAGASGSEHVFRVGVEDIDEARRRLLGLGVTVADTERIEGVIAFCDFVDPDGNRLSLYEVLG